MTKTLSIPAHTRRSPRKPEAYRLTHERLEQDLSDHYVGLYFSEMERALEDELRDINFQLTAGLAF